MRHCRASFDPPPGAAERWQVARAAAALRAGGLVLHALEGVWGLACDPFDVEAVARLLALKRRAVGKGLIVIGADAQAFAPELDQLSEAARAQVLDSWPGPETWLVANVQFPYWVTGGRPEVAIRVPGHRQARLLAAHFGGPLISTSANIAGQPPALNVWQARRRFPRGRFPTARDHVLSGQPVAPGRPSRIRTLTGTTIRP